MSLLLPGLAFIAGVVWAAVDHLDAARAAAADVTASHAWLRTFASGSLLAACVLVSLTLPLLVRQRQTSWRPRLFAAMALALAAGRIHAGLAFSGVLGVSWPQRVGVVDVVIDGASTPGARCVADVHPRTPTSASVGLERVFRIELPAEACPLAEGDVLGIPAGSLRHVPEPPRWLEPPGAVSFEGHAALRADLWFFRGHEPGAVAGWRRGYWLAIARSRQALLDAARGDDARGFVVASTLGQRAALPERATEALRRAGLWHIVSVSGLHVAVASLLALAFGLRLCAVAGLRVTWAVAGAWTLVAAYVALTGASAPAVRAGIMAGLLGLGIVLGRPVHGLTTLVVALAAMLVLRPVWIVEPGFQLSALAMAALVTGERGAGMIAQSWRLTWALAPLCLWWFGELSLVGVLLNVIAVPVFTIVVLPAGLLGGLLLPWWGGAALDPAAAGARLILDLSALAAMLPTAGNHATAFLAAGLLAFAMLRRWYRPQRHRVVLDAPRPTRWSSRFGDGLASAPSAALVAVLIVTYGQQASASLVHDAIQTRVYAIGDASHRALLLTHPSGGTCIEVSRAASLPWARWLEALGLPRPWIVVGADPASLALRERLAGVRDDGRCVTALEETRPTLEGLGGTLRSCRRLGMPSPAIVRTERVTKRWHCAMSSGWRVLP